MQIPQEQLPQVENFSPPFLMAMEKEMLGVYVYRSSSGRFMRNALKEISDRYHGGMMHSDGRGSETRNENDNVDQ